MERTRGRGRRRKHVIYEDIVPSTDLPPLVEGELRCFLFVTIGELVWGTTATHKLPPASPVYIRLRWWGEASNGTYFRPQSKRDNRSAKCRAQFGIRSGPKQISAYFNDMGSITFDILSSPTSLPIGRVLVPGVSSLTSSNPIRGFFSIMSASSRKLGELQISISFKPLKAAYEDSSDNMTDCSISTRSRNASVGGYGSRQSSLSRASSVTSTKSRSSSRGSIASRSRSSSRNRNSRNTPNTRSSSGKKRKKQRSRSRSTESRASLDVSKNEIPTPRGIDALLEHNGHNLYTMKGSGSRKKKENDIPIRTTVSMATPSENVHADAISELLKRGRRLREEINQAGVQNHPRSSPQLLPAAPQRALDQIEKTLPAPVTTTSNSIKSPFPTATVAQIVSKSSVKSNADMRILDMVFKAKGIKSIDFATPDMSAVSSSQCSLISDLDDPLHDESLLQHLFYNQTHGQVHTNIRDRKETDVTLSNETLNSTYLPDAVASSNSLVTNQQVASALSQQTVDVTKKLESVTTARVTIPSLQLSSLYLDEDLVQNRRENPSKKIEKGKKSKPPLSASPGTKFHCGQTYFVEYKFPHTVLPHKSIAVTTSNHEVTRAASRKFTKTGLVKFEHQSAFNIRFNPATITKWWNDQLEFVVYQKKPKDKKASILGTGSLPLKRVIDNSLLSYSENLKISPKSSDKLFNSKIYGILKVSLNLSDGSKTALSEINTAMESKSTQSANSATRMIKENQRLEEQTIDTQKEASPKPSPRVSIIQNQVQNQEDEVCPRIATTVLYLYIALEKAKNIPATKVQSGPGVGKCCAPNVYLVCRTFASDDCMTTPVIWNNCNPKYNFTQIIPVKINSQLFSRLRNNYVVVEVWTKVPSEQKFSDKLMGLVKIPLQLFYQSLKDSDIARAVLQADYPLVSVDGYQSVVDVFSGQERGQLKVMLALGTQLQVNALRKIRSSDDQIPDHHLDEKEEENEVHKSKDGMHFFEVSIHGIRGFTPLESQVWGETDCFVQYRFPTQHKLIEKEDSTDANTENDDVQDSISLHTYRSETTLCVPNPQFNYSKKHQLLPPPSIPVHKLLETSLTDVGNSRNSGLQFEVWSRFYYPNVRDQLLAKGVLSVAKLNALVTMTTKKVSEQTYQVPLSYVDADSGAQSAGDLMATIKYKRSSTGSKSDASQGTLPFFRNVKLQVAVLRACGLKAAAKLKATLLDDSDLNYSAEVGLNSFVKIQTSFLPSKKPHATRCVARSFSPDYNHHIEFDLPVISYSNNDDPISLAAQLASGEFLLEVWHKYERLVTIFSTLGYGDDKNLFDSLSGEVEKLRSDPTTSPSRPVVEDIEGKIKPLSDAFLGRIQIPTCGLLYKTTGCSGWYPITSMESLQHNSSSTVGAVEVAISFSCRSDLDLILRSAKSLSWSPALKSDLNRLLTPDSSGVLKPVEDADLLDDLITSSITVTNAWLPKFLLTYPGSDEISKHANIYLRYKFYDKDTAVSSICPLSNACERKTFKQHDVFPVKLAHRKSFLCRATQPLIWYLREESLEIQIWFSLSRSSRTRKRPFNADKLLGTAYIDLSSVLVGGLHRQQHISGLYPLFKAGTDDMGDAALRVYLSVSPGDRTSSYDLETADDTSGNISDNLFNSSQDSDRTVTGDAASKVAESRDHFTAIVSVERAMHLSSLPANLNPEDYPSCYVTYPVVSGDKNTVEATKVVHRSSCPVWNDAKEVTLDKKIFDKESGNLLFRVWQRENAEQTSGAIEGSAGKSDKVIGFTTVDVSVLQAGFRAVNGWYNILDIHGHCQGQIKVAVTPTEPLYVTSKPVDSSSHELSQVPSSPSKGILHSVPLLGPVQTPSGSMYYPGVATAVQASATSTSNVIKAPPISTLHSVPETTISAPINVEVLPRLALFQHDSHSALQSVLQRQMKELDRIKDAFLHKRFLDSGSPQDVKPDTDPGRKLTPTPLYVAEQSSCASRAKDLSYSSETSTATSDSKVVNPSAAPLEKVLSNDNFFLKPDSSTPESAKTKPSVHLSLLKPHKDRAEACDGAILSDNELSDVEFIQPVNLNSDSCLFLSTENSRKYEVNHGDCPELNRRDNEVYSVDDHTGNYRDKHVGNLEDDHEMIRGYDNEVIHGEDYEVNRGDHDKVNLDDDHLELNRKDPHKIHENRDGEADNNPNGDMEDLKSSDAFDVSPQVDSGTHLSDLNNTSLWLSASSSHHDPANTRDQPSDVVDSFHQDFASRNSDVNSSLVERVELEAWEESDAKNDQEEEDTIKSFTSGSSQDPPTLEEYPRRDDVRSLDGSEGGNVEEENSGKAPAEFPECNDHSESSEEERAVVNESASNLPEDHSFRPKSNKNDKNVDFESSLQTEPKQVIKIEDSPALHLTNFSNNALASTSEKSTSTIHLPAKWSKIPSFFPPPQDLIASMKSLQAITTEQKHKLLKNGENKENSAECDKIQPRRKFQKPPSYTTEQTERLARIFSTKYS